MDALRTRADKPLARALKRVSPSLFLKAQYLYLTGHFLHLKKPVRYTEKLQWLRLYGYPNDPLAVKLSGRRGLREYAKDRASDLLSDIREKKALSDESRQKIKDLLELFFVKEKK